MKVAEQKEPLRRKMSWKDQLSPKVFRFMSSSKARIPEREDEGDFRIVHFPDRPQRVVTREEIPSEDECRAMLLDIGRASMESQHSQHSQHIPETTPEYDDYRAEDDLATPMSTISTLQVPGNRSSGLSATGSFMTSRTYSPHPWVGEATTVTFEKINKTDKTDKTKHFAPEDYFPRGYPPTYTAPPVPPVPKLPEMPKLQIPKAPEEKKPAVETWSWKRLAPKPLVLRRPSRPEDALHSHPVHVHRGSVDNLCRVCHIGLAEAWGVCQHCSDECSSIDEITPASFPRPPTLSRPKAKIPHSLNAIALHQRPRPSLFSNPESTYSEPLSPLSPISPTTVYTPMTLEIPEDRPLTPLSAMPTPHLIERLEKKGDDDRNVYEEEWADYYFDNGNFTARRRDSEVDDFMLRELSLEEYDGVFASPVNPGPGWI